MREAEELDGGVQDLSSMNHDLEFQVSEISRHANILNKQNTDLNSELTEILIRDKLVKEELNRIEGLTSKQ